MTRPGETTVTLWRSSGPTELDLTRAAEVRAFPPRLLDWTPAEDLDVFNVALVGTIQVTHEFR